MATHRIPILGYATKPDTSGKAWFEPYSILATNDVADRTVLRIDENANNNTAITTKAGVYGAFEVPQNFVGSAAIVIVWTSTKTTGDAVFDFDYRGVGGDDSESLDQATWQESVTVTDTAPGATDRRLETSVNLTSSNLAAGDTVPFFFGCDGVDAADTLAGARLVHGLYFQYADG